MTFIYIFQSFPSFNQRKYVGNFETISFCFGTVLYAFEGIALILPLQNAMKKPESFSSLCGVLNVGQLITTFIFLSVGIFGYWHYGDDVLGSVTLNLPTEEM